jgi:hypothetical protein
MRFIVLLILLSMSVFAQAQTVERITGRDALVTLRNSEALAIGDKVHFLNDKLNTTGQGEVKKFLLAAKRSL